jgi:NAD(P) transhydrogenase subunit beta
MTVLLQSSYFIAMLTFVVGLKFLSFPKRAKAGNFIAAMGMTLACIITLMVYFYDRVSSINFLLILLAIGIGTIGGKIMSDKVKMTGMPQLVSFLNAMGGGCALLLGILEAQQIQLDSLNRIELIPMLAGLSIGSIAFSGSIIAYLKLGGKMKDKRSIGILILSRFLLFSLIAIPVFNSILNLNIDLVTEVLILGFLALIYGVVFVLPIGGADMPVVISLLNSLTGVATALAGIIYNNYIMISGGIFVGAAGLLLTQMMCTAMNRSLWKVLAGKFKKSQGNVIDEEIEIQSTSIGETAAQLAYANKVAIIPGYGLAVSQAQLACSQLQRELERNNTEVHYIIHPVAGRMPGHMNVLLAEADVPYDRLKEMDEVNDTMNEYDVAIIIGANDVVNPAAEQDAHSPIYGMPIIRAYNATSVVVIKRGMNKGYAGVENKLFGFSNCRLLFSDAKKALEEIVSELKTLDL